MIRTLHYSCAVTVSDRMPQAALWLLLFNWLQVSDEGRWSMLLTAATPIAARPPRARRRAVSRPYYGWPERLTEADSFYADTRLASNRPFQGATGSPQRPRPARLRREQVAATRYRRAADEPLIRAGRRSRSGLRL